MRQPAMRAVRFWAGAVVGMVAAILLTHPPAARAASYSPGSYAARVLSLVNDIRVQHGLRPLTLTSGTAWVASSWTQHLATTQELAHNPDLAHQLATHGSSGWLAYGENVAKGWVDKPDAMVAAYMNSAEHRDNILTSAFRYVGVAVVFTGSRAWNTMDFVDVYDAVSTAPQSPAHHQPAQAPAPVSTAVTAAPAPAGPRTGDHAAHRRAGAPIEVEAVRRPPLHRSVRSPVSAAAPTSSGAALAGASSARRLPIMVAIAVLVLVAASRRWLLEVCRPAA